MSWFSNNIMGASYDRFNQAENVYKKTVDSTKKYEKNLALYNSRLPERTAHTDYDYLNIVQPFQLIVESSTSDFQEGLGEGMKKAAEKMANGISNFLRVQVLNKEFPIDTFQTVDNKLAYGMTVYVLTDADMRELEARIKENCATGAPPSS